MRIISSFDHLKSFIGKQIGVSGWIDVTQQRIDNFADATGDRQWIHVDVARSRRESPFGEPVAHGFLTLALLPVMLAQTIAMPEAKMSVNYGLNKVRFPSPLPAGSRVRGTIALISVAEFTEGEQIVWEITVDKEGGGKPVCIAELITRCYS